MNKTCTKCGQGKDASEFSRRSNGLRSHCKVCCNAYGKKYNLTHKSERSQLSMRWHKANPERTRKNTLEWRKENKERVKKTRNEYDKEYHKLYPEKKKAGNAIANAIRSERLIVQPCEDCGQKPRKVNNRQIVEAHHHRGYSEEHQLHIQWLCQTCHRNRHFREKNIQKP